MITTFIEPQVLRVPSVTEAREVLERTPAVNTDASVELSRPERMPINSDRERMEVIAALEARYDIDNHLNYYFQYAWGVLTRFDFFSVKDSANIIALHDIVRATWPGG